MPDNKLWRSFEHFAAAVITGIIGVIAVAGILGWDYLYWDRAFLFVEADNVIEYLKKVWYLPAAAGLFSFFTYLKYGLSASSRIEKSWGSYKSRY